MMDEITQSDIRTIMGNHEGMDASAYYQWFDRDVETFQIMKGYRVKATATLSVDTETRCTAPSKDEAIKIARGLTKDAHGESLLRWILDSVEEMDK